jgi:hypothetical protein
MISISVESDLVVVRPHGELDRAATETLVGVVGAATSCGSVVALTLDEAMPAPSPVAVDQPRGDGGTTAVVEVVGAGRVRFSAGGIDWTVDLPGRRFCRTEGRVDWRFVGPAGWTPISGLWAGPARIAVLTDDGVVSLDAGWSGSTDSAPPRLPTIGRVRGSAA